MDDSDAALDRLQNDYKAAVEAWIVAIRAEEALASVNHSVAEIDIWEDAYFKAEAQRSKVTTAKQAYEAALRSRFFGID